MSDDERTLLAYRGKADCRDVTCTRMPDGTCVGWHCPLCGQSTSYQGHDCTERGEQ